MMLLHKFCVKSYHTNDSERCLLVKQFRVARTQCNSRCYVSRVVVVGTRVRAPQRQLRNTCLTNNELLTSPAICISQSLVFFEKVTTLV